LRKKNYRLRPLACAATLGRRRARLAQVRYGNSAHRVRALRPGRIRTSRAALTWLNLPGGSHVIEWASGAPRGGINEMSQPYQSGGALAFAAEGGAGRGDQ